jgi:GntR family transcriptional regulator
MLIRLDSGNSEPLFRQIAGQIRQSLADGTLAAGTRLPPARELASSVEVNLHTVLRAYQQLANEGLVEMRRGRGVTVVGSPPRADLAAAALALVTAARNFGLADTDIHELIAAQL